MATSKSSQAVVLAISALVAVGKAFEEISSDRCDCFLTNGTTASYFAGHKFFDFRLLPQHAYVPAHIEDAYESSYVTPASEYFISEEWTSTWGIQGWNNSRTVDAGVAPVLMVHSPNNVYVETNQDDDPASETFMTLRTIRLRDYQSSAEFESVDQGYQFVSMRMLARTIGAPGAITAMFTYRGAEEFSRIQESDLEFRTIDPPNTVQCTNQPAVDGEGAKVDRATRNVTMPGRLTYRDWAVYRMDWTPADTTWYINGQNVASIAFQSPRDPSILMFNSWSDGGSWTGNMTMGNEAYLHVQWIELVYNTTTPENSKREEGQCYNVCSIDETETVGIPVLLQGGASGLLDRTRGFGSVVSWIPWLGMAAMICST
ncbi:hypothetical protein DL767_001181 [Monosporascus sp. MG133]|nr:hypothetical protein DL767_001181 [Monosporascus sp. MG133]